MDSAPELKALAWLVMLWGLALMVISVRRAKGQSRSLTRRVAGILGGSVFCLLAAIPIWAESSTAAKALLGAAVLTGAVSWYLGRHVRSMDRAMKKAG
ncbi:MAG: hypothetical protein ABJC19_10410 [Gemmatimonadota bacterium]